MTRIPATKSVLVGAFALAGMIGFCGRTAKGATWEVGTVDATGVGRYSSLKIDSDGNAHVAYVVDDRNTLKYGFWDHTIKRWFTMTVAEGATFCSLALDSKHRPHISYVDYGAAREAKLRYARWNGTIWAKTSIPLADGVAYYTSIVVDDKDNPQISFYDHLDRDNNFVLHLRTVSWNGTYWELRTVDSQEGSGKFSFMTTDSKGATHIAYANVKDEYASLRYAFKAGQSWAPEVLDGIGMSTYVWAVAMAVDKQDNPHITYTAYAKHLLKYAVRIGGKWEIDVVTSIAQPAYPDRNGIAVDREGNPYISYYDGALRVVFRSGKKWFGEIVDHSGTGFTSSIQIDHDAIWVVYTDEDAGCLKFARRPWQGDSSPTPPEVLSR